MADKELVTEDKKTTDFMSLVKFDQTKKDVLEMAQMSKDLKIDGMEDKDGYKAVHEAQMVLQKIRVKGEKDRLEFSRMLIDTSKKLKVYHDDIFAPVIEEEARLKAMKDEVEAEKKKIKDAQAQKERERLQGMVSIILKNGMTVNHASPRDNTEYVFGNLGIEMVLLSTMSDEAFNEFVAKLVEAKKAEDDRIAEEERLRKEQEAKDKKERDEFEEKQRLQEQKEKELQAKEDEINAEKKRLDDEKNEKARREAEDKRVKEAAENAKKETEERIKVEAKEKAEREAEEKRVAEEKIEKNKKYTDWLKKNGVTAKAIASKEFIQAQDGATFTLYKRVDEITIE